MELLEFKKLMEKLENLKTRNDWLKECVDGEKYYLNENDIKRRLRRMRDDNPLKTADNRISHNWHGLLVNQKAGYLFGKDPQIDVGDKDLNKEIKKCLGDEWHKTLVELAVKASNKGVAWLHLWVEVDAVQYGIVPSEEILPVFSSDLKRRLVAVIRKYRAEDENGTVYLKYEYWDEKSCSIFAGYGCGVFAKDKEFTHPFRRVPFIYFGNNNMSKSDLYMYRDLINQFDSVISGYANDIEDVQEIIFVLEGYGGEDLEEFMTDLKDFKAVKTDDKGDVRTIKAEIPVEAREKFLENLKKSIFLFGMGVNPDKDSLGDSSGVALKFLYSLLELKASATRNEFECSIKVLVRSILRHMGKENDQDIDITFYRNMITNDKEVTEIISKSAGVISDKTRTKNHPYTENLDDEMKQMREEAKELDPDYAFGSGVTGDE